MSSQRSLSPAQIQYLKIGPKAGNSQESRRQISQALALERNKLFVGQSSNTSSLNKIPKLTYGEFEKTVSNFGVLINKNFGNETVLHQSQKFGKMALDINKVLIQEKDKPLYSEKKNALLKKIKDRSDNRTTLNAVYEFMNNKLHVTLKSFGLISEKGSETGLPIPYLKFLIGHVNSSRLVKIIEPSLKNEGNQVVVEFDKIESRAGHLSNGEAKYQNIDYSFERFGQILTIELPKIEFSHPQTEFRQELQILNKQILQIIENGFENVNDIVEKYLDAENLQRAIEEKEIAQREQEEEAEEKGEVE